MTSDATRIRAAIIDALSRGPVRTEMLLAVLALQGYGSASIDSQLRVLDAAGAIRYDAATQKWVLL